jgi:hypothetical protein
MNDPAHELFESELRRLAPAQPPAELMARLANVPRNCTRPSTVNPQPLWRLLARWLVPAAAAAVLAATLLGWWAQPKAAHPRVKAVSPPPKPASKPDEIEIDRQLVALFDTVAQLPNGEPVRFRCRQWTDEVTLRDPDHGLVIERRTPRLEVVPVSIETF